MPTRKTAQARTRQPGGAVRSFLVFAVGLAGLVAAVLAGGGYLAYREATRPGPGEEPTIVMLKPGASVSAIADELRHAGVIRYAELFSAVARLRRQQSQLKAGEYEIPARSSVMEIIDILVAGKSVLHYFTAPEGRTTAQILALIAQNDVLAGEIALAPGEGELLPETYGFTRGDTRDAVIRRMMKDQDALIEELWPARALELPFATPEEAIVLASIVEKETGLSEERSLIAAVFINRLKRGMRLESDPTVIYGLTGGEPLARGLRQSELRGATPYNTYMIFGLPPTPIANPGRASIEAVLNPSETDDLYFVADGAGGHLFASNLRDHQTNVAAWRRIELERQQGE